MIVRYADDIVVGFAHEVDARRFWDAMRKRFEEFALSLHPEKTCLIEFGRHAADRHERRRLTLNPVILAHVGKLREGRHPLGYGVGLMRKAQLF